MQPLLTLAQGFASSGLPLGLLSLSWIKIYIYMKRREQQNVGMRLQKWWRTSTESPGQLTAQSPPLKIQDKERESAV